MPTIEAETAARLAALLAPDGGCEAVLPLVTDRLILRPPVPGDAAALLPLAGSWEVARQTAKIPFPLSEQDILAWTERAAARRRAGHGLALVITDREGGTPIGAIELSWDDTWPEAEIGYWIGEAFQSRGLATEAGRALLDLAFEAIGVSRVFASARSENPASLKVMEHLGLRPDGQRVQIEAAARGELWEHDRRSLDRTGWAAARAARARLVLVVAAALIDRDGRVLLTRRPEGKAMAGLWEFPGGKVHDGETPEQALIRELDEELGIDARRSCLAPLTFASHAYPDFHLLMPLYVLRSWSGTLQPREGQEIAWTRAARLRDYPMPPADPPLIPALQDLLEG
jgi:8-oxo-dGTP diphosphatase